MVLVSMPIHGHGDQSNYQFMNNIYIPVRLSYWVITKVVIDGVETFIYDSNTLENILVRPGELINIPKAKTSEYYVEYEDFLRIGKFDIYGLPDGKYTAYNNDTYKINKCGNLFKITQ